MYYTFKITLEIESKTSRFSLIFSSLLPVLKIVQKVVKYHVFWGLETPFKYFVTGIDPRPNFPERVSVPGTKYEAIQYIGRNKSLFRFSVFIKNSTTVEQESMLRQHYYIHLSKTDMSSID